MLLWKNCYRGDGCVLDLVRPPLPPPSVIVNDYDTGRLSPHGKDIKSLRLPVTASIILAHWVMW